MGKKASFFDKYWFAIGYHRTAINADEPPSEELVDYVMVEHGIDISESYNQGIKACKKDMENGYV